MSTPDQELPANGGATYAAQAGIRLADKPAGWRTPKAMTEAAAETPSRLCALLTEFPRVGPASARFFCGEARTVWPRAVSQA